MFLGFLNLESSINIFVLSFSFSSLLLFFLKDNTRMIIIAAITKRIIINNIILVNFFFFSSGKSPEKPSIISPFSLLSILCIKKLIFLF